MSVIDPEGRSAKAAYLKSVFASRSHAKACEACRAADARLEPWACCRDGLQLIELARKAREASDAETTRAKTDLSGFDVILT